MADGIAYDMAEAASSGALTPSPQVAASWEEPLRAPQAGEGGQPIGEPPPIIEPVGFDDPFETRPISVVQRPMRRSFLAPVANGSAPAERLMLPDIRTRTLDPAASVAVPAEAETPAAPAPEIREDKTEPAPAAAAEPERRGRRVRVLQVALLVLLIVVAGLSLRPAPVDAEAELAQGIQYAKGDGTKQDYAAAAKHFRAAAEQGLARAQYDLGVLYERGRGVPLDYAQAVAWYKRAAEGKHALAQYNLAVAYSKGEGVERNLFDAAVWYNRAALQGMPPAMVNLAILYERGEGVQMSQANAYAWYRAAARRGSQPAAQRANELLKAFSASEQTQAEAKTREVALAVDDTVGKNDRVADARPSSVSGIRPLNLRSGFDKDTGPAPTPTQVNETPALSNDKSSDTGDLNP